MFDAKALNDDLQHLLKAIDREFGFKADDLASAMAKIGRRLPRSAHKSAAILIEAQQQALNPKIVVQMDNRALRPPYRRLLSAIKAHDRKDARLGVVLGALGSLAVNLIVLSGIVFAVLRWRGFV